MLQFILFVHVIKVILARKFEMYSKDEDPHSSESQNMENSRKTGDLNSVTLNKSLENVQLPDSTEIATFRDQLTETEEIQQLVSQIRINVSLIIPPIIIDQ